MIIVRLLSPGPWLVRTTKVYSGVGADIVMESITLKTPSGPCALRPSPSSPHCPDQASRGDISQRIMLAAPRAKSIREAEKVFLVNLVEDGGHGLLHKLVFQGCNPQWALSPICFLYVHSSRWLRAIRSTMNSAMEIDQSIFNPDFIFLPCDPVHSGCGFSLE